MLKAIWCWLVGWPCAWQTERKYSFQRFAYGLYINTMQPVVTVERCERICTKCGRTKIKDTVHEQ